ncbi:MAG TPA: hypothetical protein IAB02_01735 [Candidatus Pullichristensenella excrementigallinarum]|uniref:Uncharacterized protein n=1 Tax=Candidatus Pullichristensenella excrementigallinarum TaxID=2840907 RepID=A0A9D1IAI0_9FIRM|nr:hypothetical protein [Candidatus Pullichristensenella excrementigallinarum]
MISKSEEVYAILCSAAGNARVSLTYPGWWTEVPAVGYREAINRVHRRADGKEYLTELRYDVDIWAAGAKEALEIAQSIDEAMAAAGYQRTHAADLFDAKTRFHRRSLGYRIVADPDGHGYQ